MTRLIDADALLEALKEFEFSHVLENIYDLITNAPTVQREPFAYTDYYGKILTFDKTGFPIYKE